MRLAHGSEELVLDPSGLLHWPAQRLAVVADLPLEKGAASARRGVPPPPSAPLAPPDRLGAALARLRPRAVVSLGDAFHDRHGAALLDSAAAARLRDLTNAFAWTWIAGNHDPDPPAGLGGVAVPEMSLGGLTFRHEPRGEPGEVAGHLHPKARVPSARLRLTRPCFATDGRVLLLPAFGTLTGGLNVLDAAIAGLFPAGFAAFLLGEERVFRVPHACLSPDPAAGLAQRLA